MNNTVCPSCGGSGKQKVADQANDPGVSVPICLVCSGEGQIAEKPEKADYDG